MVDLELIFSVSTNILEALKSEQTEDAVKEILGLTEDVKEKVVDMFSMAEDAADDVVEIALIAMNTLEKVRDEVFTSRAVVKPASQMTTFDDVIAATALDYRSQQA